MISQRTKAALAAAKARGKKLGNPNYQHALACARAALDFKPPPAGILDLMVQWRRDGSVWREIAGNLNEMNVRTPRGAKWYPSTVRAALLRNRADAYTSLLPAAGIAATPFACPQPEVRGEAKGGMPMPSDIKEAERMLNLFTSVGARSFVVTKIDIEKNTIWGKSYSVAELVEKLPAMVRTAAIRHPQTLKDGRTVKTGENLIVRPSGPDVAFVQLDDLGSDQLDRIRPAAFLMHATSPGSHQAWIAVSDVPNSGEPFKALMRRVRKAVGGNDKSASHATRVAGTENFKVAYVPDYPTVTIIHAAPGRVMTPELLRDMGLLAEPEPERMPAPARVSSGYDRPWPSYQITLSRTRPKRDGSGPDRSVADYSFCLTAITGGKTIEDTIVKLLEVSQNAQERAARGDEGYARITVENAAAAVARNWGRNRA
jgi:hypothetical protein